MHGDAIVREVGASHQRRTAPMWEAVWPARAGLVRESRDVVDARWVSYERDEPACAAALTTFERLLR